MDVDKFEKINSQLFSFFEEVGALSKKKPDDAINKFKLKFINKVIDEANELLVNDYKPFEDFTRFDEDDMPSNSDIIFILSQYINCMEILKKDNIATRGGLWYWVVNGQQTSRTTSRPKNN